MENEKKKYVYRLPPCPAYDVEGMESWLCALAWEGLLLRKDGFHAGVAVFEKAAPRQVKYRLEAAQENGELIDAAEELPKSFVLTQEFGAQRVYLTKYNAAVLTRRFETARERAAYPFGKEFTE